MTQNYPKYENKVHAVKTSYTVFIIYHNVLNIENFKKLSRD